MLIVRVEDPPAVTGLGVKLAVAPAGRPLALRLMLSAVPLRSVVLSVDGVLVPPCVALTLVGLALILFYTLLLSFSEYTGFDTAYLIASVATVGLIGWFIKSVLRSAKASTILSVVLVLLYSYVFSLLQLQDYSLLLGSIGLFLTLAIVMYFSRKMQW